MMKKILFSFSLLFFILNGGISAAEISNFDTLIEYSKLDSIPDPILLRAEKIVDELLLSKESSPHESITHFFGLICLKATTEKGVSSYIQYLISQEGSAEEELSFRFEPIFFKSPDVVLSKIRNEYSKFQKLLLDHIGWGFLNNTPSVTRASYKRIFFEKNPDIKDLYKVYRAEIDLIFQRIDKYYVWLENRKK